MVSLIAIGRPSGGRDSGLWSWKCLAPKKSSIQRIISVIVTVMLSLIAVGRPNEGGVICPAASC